MIEVGVFHNGASDLPVKRTADGVVINEGDLAATHASAQRVLVNQVRQGILAARLGFDYFWASTTSSSCSITRPHQCQPPSVFRRRRT